MREQLRVNVIHNGRNGSIIEMGVLLVIELVPNKEDSMGTIFPKNEYDMINSSLKYFTCLHISK